MAILPYEVAQAVQADGLARVATADDDTQHVLYLDGDTLRSIAAADWPPPLPTDPTQAESDAAIAAREAAKQQAESDAAALRQKIVTLAQSAVGLSVDTLTAAQTRALVAVLLWQAGALTRNGTVRPLAEWR